MCVFINLLRTCNRSGFPSQTRARMHFERTRAIPIGLRCVWQGDGRSSDVTHFNGLLATHRSPNSTRFLFLIFFCLPFPHLFILLLLLLFLVIFREASSATASSGRSRIWVLSFPSRTNFTLRPGVHLFWAADNPLSIFGISWFMIDEGEKSRAGEFVEMFWGLGLGVSSG